MLSGTYSLLCLTLLSLFYCGLAQNSDYLCNGQCDVTRARCDCTNVCVAAKNCCSDYLTSCQGGTAWIDDECPTQQQLGCPSGFPEPPVILFSIDGFQAEYLYREKTPNVFKLASCGVHASYMRAVYPTITFPSHYTIATGLYAESHGVIENSMFDHQHKEEFYLGSPNTFHPFWWEGEPIWVTVSNQNKKSATYFWPGSDVNITRYPDYYYTYDGSVPNEERIYTALEWLDMPSDERPSLITLYVSDLDHAGHVGGPDSDDVTNELQAVDDIISLLMNGLKVRGLENCVNFVLLADHGMSPQSCDRLNYIDKYGVDMSLVNFYGGALGRVGKSRDETLWNEFKPAKIVDQLKCTHENSRWLAYQKSQYFPKRYHYANHDRIEQVQLVMDDTWLVGGETGTMDFCDGGMHGYDNEFRSMHSLFVAHGPGFKTEYNTTEPFESVEVYNLLTDLLSLDPAPNNGTPGALHHVMAQPSDVPAPPNGQNAAVCEVNSEPPASTDKLGCTYCQGLSELEANQRLPVTVEEVAAVDAANSLYGRPTIYVEPMQHHCLLGQKDFTNEHNIDKKQPVYVTFTLQDVKRDMEAPVGCSRSDYRMLAFQTGCSSYTDQDTVKSAFLYPPELSNGDAVHDALIRTNTVPMYPATAEMWSFMAGEMGRWANDFGGLAVTAGPVFDYDYDGLPDTNDTIVTQGQFLGSDITATPIPTHFFLVMTRCAEVGTPIMQCTSSPDDVEVLSFIIPNFEEYPCRKTDEPVRSWGATTLTQHVARIRDVELVAGLNFFPLWTRSESQTTRRAAIRRKVFLPQFTSDWLQDLGASPATRTSPQNVLMSLACLLATFYRF